MARIDGRGNKETRKIVIIPDVNPYAEGSAEVSFGKTKLLCTATVEKEVPDWLKHRSEGWITAEYGMLPRSTHTRNKREASAGKQSGRTQEIQRLVGRALRAAIDPKKLGPFTIRIDCDVISADGGTRTAAISGAWVALYRAVEWMKENVLVPDTFRLTQVAAISVGKVRGELMLDLAYEEDSAADFDMNVVCNNKLEIIELQGTAERGALTVVETGELIQFAQHGIEEIFKAQLEALNVR
jgi:ribonuclease PH